MTDEVKMAAKSSIKSESNKSLFPPILKTQTHNITLAYYLQMIAKEYIMFCSDTFVLISKQ